MFKVQNTSAIQSQHETLQLLQKNRAESCFASGTRALIQAHEQGFADPLSCRKACEYFVESIRLSPEDPRPYLMLAYLFAIHQDDMTAWQYQMAAQELAPTHSDVNHFRLHLQSLQLAKHQGSVFADTKSQNTEPSSVQEPEQDQEYLRLELRMKNRIQSISRQQAPIATANPQVLEEQEENNKRFHENQQLLAVRIETLEESLDTSSLYKLLQELDQVWEPYELILRQSRALAAFKAKILQTQLHIIELLGQCAAANCDEDIDLLEKELESLLDQCDNYTGIFEALLRHRVPVHEVEAVYQNLQGQVDLFRETLDDRLAAITYMQFGEKE